MKQTEIGMIPDDWEDVKLKDLYIFRYGEGNKNPSNNGFYPVYGANGIIGKYTKYNSESAVVIGHMGEYAGSVLWAEGKHFVTYNGTIAKPKSNIIIDSKFGFYELLRLNINKICAGSGYPFLSYDKLNDLNIPLPPTLDEQQKIAKALSDLDNVISTLEKLITKKKNLKQGTMQQLLTGKKRLLGFAPAVVEPVETPATKQTELGEIPADWEVKTFGECCVKITDGSHFSPIEIENGFYMPSVKDMTATGFSFSDCKTISYNDYKKLVKMGCQPEIGDVLIAKDGSILKYAFSVKEKQDIVILSSIAILKPKSELLDPDFLAHYVSYPKFIEYAINNFKTGTGVPRIVLKGFAKLVILLPSKSEQTAIANVLSSMDKEIEALNTKLEKYRNLKTGMMQQLLTGKIRLV